MMRHCEIRQRKNLFDPCCRQAQRTRVCSGPVHVEADICFRHELALKRLRPRWAFIAVLQKEASQ